MKKWCKKCGKFLEPMCGSKKVNPKREFCDIKCKTRHNAKLEFYRKRKIPEEQKKKREKYKEWYQKNKERQHKNVLKNYYKNKHKWKERNYVNLNKKAILKILPKKCEICEKEEIKEIHHTKYEFPKRNPFPTKEEKKKYLIWYCQFLVPFCSRSCHEDYAY